MKLKMDFKCKISIKKIILPLILCCFYIPLVCAQDTLLLGDLEGRNESVKALIKNGELKLVKGKLEFVKPTTNLVFGGDLPDRGPHSIELRRWLLSLKDRHPDRVTLILGNRDLNKIDILRELPELESLKDKDYRSWLETSLKNEKNNIPKNPKQKSKVLMKQNTLARQLEFWLDSHGGKDYQKGINALEFHRIELEKLSGKKVSVDSAAKDYLKSIKPGGEHFEFLKKGELLGQSQGFFVSHGGITEMNAGIIPGETRREADPRKWIRSLNKWKDKELNKVETLAVKKGLGRHIPGLLTSYGDARWDAKAIDPETGRKGVLTFNSQSTVYPARDKSDGNLRMTNKKAENYLKKGGFKGEVRNHTPIPVPLILQEGGFTTVYADNSFSDNNEKRIMKITKGSLIAQSVTPGGTLVFSRSDKAASHGIGKITEDGFVVVGRTKKDEYVLFKYYQGYTPLERVVPAKEFKKLKLLTPRAKISEEVTKRAAITKANIEAKGKKIITLSQASGLVEGKQVIVESGASRYGQWPVSKSKMREDIKRFYDKFDAKSLVIISGGTDPKDGVETLVHSYAKKRGIPVIGFIQEGAEPSELKSVKKFVFSGPVGDWDAPLQTSIEFAKQNNGSVIFRGGGGVVTKGIEFAESSGAKYHLMNGKGGGASVEAAKKYPKRAFTNVSELSSSFEKVDGEKLGKVAPKKIGIYTGSFDPPHLGHKNIVTQMKKKFGLDIVYVIPDSNTSYKPGLQKIEHRNKMTELMFRDSPGVRVMPGNSPEFASSEIWDVTKGIQGGNKSSKIYNIMGTDTLNWYKKQPESKNVKTTLLVNRRDRTIKIPKTLRGQKVIAVETGDVGYSSSALRKKLVQGNTNAKGLPKSVAKYIRESGIYKKVAKTVTPNQAVKAIKAKGKKVITFIGYSGAEYENKDKMLSQAREQLSKYDPKKTIINIGATPEGIGDVYRLAQDMGFETSGIVSTQAKKYGGPEILSAHVNEAYYIKDNTWGGYTENSKVLSPTSLAMVNVSDEIISIGGGAVGRDELIEASKRGKKVTFIDADMNHEKALLKAKKAGKPAPTAKQLRGEAYEGIKKSGLISVASPGISQKSSVKKKTHRSPNKTRKVPDHLDPSCIQDALKKIAK